MNTSLEHLPTPGREQLKKITEIIVAAIRPEKIILFGRYAATTGVPRLSWHDNSLPPTGGFDLLVITRRGERRYEHEVQDLIENRCRAHVPVTVLVHDMDYMNEQLSQGGYFFSMLRVEGILLFDARTVPIAKGSPPDLAAIRIRAEKDFGAWWSKAEAYYRSALFNRQGKEWKLAAFLLHQAAESAYQAVLLTFTGYKPCTHNLDKLRRYTSRFSLALTLVFPCDNPGEEYLFRLLLIAYVDARYKEEYAITENEVDILIGRLADLLSVTARICRNRLTSLGKMEKAGFLA
ncbi:MAG: HEPN domain-containing protein [Bacteroidota bacterium]|nr:HEPN domain-containing protein [Bacteroidota bacterium]MDP4216723.1 HEPN domain-containing protein [Bacteroidota bacterium]MDP4248442.1 HEPN domain-containing protein [Bacteroidota bacterium]MDP4254443.1 HEPN domain-containing protein [Bacteroidota bacterium]MDP4259271.1 HEPN domain-containing protein [Bacteroidota bacterium]